MLPETTLEQKEDFLRENLMPALRGIDPATLPTFGKMRFPQMVEHLVDFVRLANGRTLADCDQPIAHLDKLYAFLMSDKPFRDNTPNAMLPDEPPAPRHTDLQEALGELQVELDGFFDVFAQDHQRRITNPIFGDLNYEEQVQLLWKHTRHHLRQFGVTA